MVGWLEHRCAANSQGVEVDFNQVRLEEVTRTVYTFCLVPSFFSEFFLLSLGLRFRGCH